MDKVTIVKVVACVVGGIVAITVISTHPIQVVLLAVCAAAYIYAEKVVK